MQNAQGSDATQLSLAQADITKGDSVLIMDPLDSGVGKSIEKYAAAHGAVVIDYDRLTLGGSRKYYVSFDNVKVGTLIGNGLVSCIADWKVKNPNVLVMRGDPTDNNATLFAQGYDAVLAPHFSSGWKNVGKTAGTWDPPTALTEFQQQFTAHPNINALLSPNDENAAPIIHYLQTKGVKAKTFPVTGQDATLVGLQNILAGYQCGTAYKPIYLEAQAAAALAMYLRAGADPAGRAGERQHQGHDRGRGRSLGALDAGVGYLVEYERHSHRGQLRPGEPALHGEVQGRLQGGGNLGVTE